MRFVFMAALLAAATLALPAEAASSRHNRHATLGGHVARPSSGYDAWPYYQGTPEDRLPIFRYGRYQGNDPDNRIRLQLMRDPPNNDYR